jgi:erythritol transport system ATP-binding protein
MVGRTAKEMEFDLRDEFGEVALKLRDIKIADQFNTARLSVDGLDLDVRAGEVVCLYGLMGAGRTELLEALAGRLPIQDGTVELLGKPLGRESIGERIDLGMTLVPEDRQRDGLVQTMSVGDNIALSSLKSFIKGLWISKSRRAEGVRSAISDVTVKTNGPEAAITSLSGGNQQKVVIGRVLLTTPQVLLLDEPTRGIDVGAKAEIFKLMAREARRGLAVLYATSEVDEALSASNRLIVMSKGKVVGEFDPKTSTREEIMAASGEAVGARKVEA